MLAWLGSTLLSSGIGALFAPLTHILDTIANTKVMIAHEENATQREALIAKLGVLQSRADLMAREAPYSRLNIWIRTIIASGPATVLCKIFIYDKALGQWTGGTTDALSPELWHTIWVVLGFYFLYEGVAIFKRF
jgi:hypothetical protein